jgi:hypothetical protein
MRPDFHSISTTRTVARKSVEASFSATLEAGQSESAGRECEALQTEPC